MVIVDDKKGDGMVFVPTQHGDAGLARDERTPYNGQNTVTARRTAKNIAIGDSLGTRLLFASTKPRDSIFCFHPRIQIRIWLTALFSFDSLMTSHHTQDDRY
jgi:hypothetical protein